MLSKIYLNRALLLELVRRDFIDKYNGSMGGVAWSFFQPLFLLTVYTIAFGVILKARWGGAGSTVEYAFMLFAGLIVYNAFSETLSKSTGLIVNNPNFVKKILFPLELLPIVTVATVLIHALISCLIWFTGYIIVFGVPHIEALLFPLVFICLTPLLLAVSWFFSSISVYLRDIEYIGSLINHTLLFLTPIFYSIETAPTSIKSLLLINPLTYAVEMFRDVLFRGDLPTLSGFLGYFAVTVFLAYLGSAVFKRLQPTFPDFL